ncbi:MAG: radical SAM protein [Candidatus Omnitrophica bacterium]|nr:radical SAM protein [Candidatus Omnitrophota bacterium]MDD5552717.1 radical SAM protein [Candidatus Omnitrophota bacterium]
MITQIIPKRIFCCIGISQECIFKCKMCFFWKNKYERTEQEPTLQEWYNFISLLADLGENTVEINLAGGEPLLDERNLKLVDFAAKKGVYTSLSSNGFLINKEMASSIARSGLDVIGISLDGIDENTHDFLRGVQGSYDKIMKGIDHLERHCGHLTIGIQTVISDRNLDEVIRLTEWVNAHRRIRYIVFQAIEHPFNTPLDLEWHNKSEYAFLWPRDTHRVNNVIDELIRLKGSGYKITNPVSQLEIFKAYFADPGKFIKQGKCNVSENYMNINQFGDIFLCLRKESIGNIRTFAPEEFWHSQKVDRIRKEMGKCRDNCHHLVNCCYKEEHPPLLGNEIRQNIGN